MASNVDYIREGLGAIGEGASSYGAHRKEEARLNTPLKPGIAKALGLSPDDEDEAKALLESGESPKQVAIYMKQKMQGAPQGPSESVFQGIAPGQEGGVSSNMLAQASREPSPFSEQGLAAQAPNAQPSSLGQMAASAKPQYTVRDAEAMTKYAPAIRAMREPIPRETPGERAARETANIQARGGYQTEAARIGATQRGETAAAGQEVQKKAIAAANERNRQDIISAQKIADDRLRQVRTNMDIRGGDRADQAKLHDAIVAVEKLDSLIANYAKPSEQYFRTPESDVELRSMKDKLAIAVEHLKNLREEQSGKKPEPSTMRKTTTSTPKGMSQGVGSVGEVRTLHDGRRVRKTATGYELVP